MKLYVTKCYHYVFFSIKKKKLEDKSKYNCKNDPIHFKIQF